MKASATHSEILSLRRKLMRVRWPQKGTEGTKKELLCFLCLFVALDPVFYLRPD